MAFKKRPGTATRQRLEAYFVHRERDITAIERGVLGPYAAFFLEEVLVTGRWDAAWSRTLKLCQREFELPDAPRTRGSSLRGSLELDGHSARDYHGAAVNLLGELVTLDGHRQYLPWLLESLKIAYDHELGLVIAALDRIELSRGELDRACAELIDNARRRIGLLRSSRDIIKSVRLTMFRDARFRWMVPMIDTLIALGPDARELLDAALPRLSPHFYGGSSDEPVSWPGMEDAFRHPHPTVHILAVTVVERGAIDPGPVLDCLVGFCRHDDEARIGLRAAHVVDFLARANVRLRDEHVASLEAEVARLEASGRPDELSRQLRVLIANQRSSELEVEVALKGRTRATITCNALCSAAVWLAPDRLVIAVQRRLQRSPPKEWRTDADAFALVLVDLGERDEPDTSGCTRIIELPVEFPIHATGGYGVKRKVLHLRGLAGGEVLMVILSPFSDQRGWGNENFVFRCDPDAGQWWVLESRAAASDAREDDGDEARYSWTDPPATEADIDAVCYGELVLKESDGELVLVTDTTPYHLDDWEYSAMPLGAIAGGMRPAAKVTGERKVKVNAPMRWQ